MLTTYHAKFIALVAWVGVGWAVFPSLEPTALALLFRPHCVLKSKNNPYLYMSDLQANHQAENRV
jgi:hypothetical protein